MSAQPLSPVFDAPITSPVIALARWSTLAVATPGNVERDPALAHVQRLAGARRRTLGVTARTREGHRHGLASVLR